MEKVTSRNDSIARRMRDVSIAFAAVLLTIAYSGHFSCTSVKKRYDGSINYR
jgi:hypothetical protein